MSYVLQDLQCKKCQQVCPFSHSSNVRNSLNQQPLLQIKRENLSQFCSCAGEYQLLQPASKLKDTLTIFERVSSRFRMVILHQMVEQFLGNVQSRHKN